MTNGTEKKGLSPFAWIAIGCGGLVLVGVVAVVGVLGFGFFKAKEFVEENVGDPSEVLSELQKNPTKVIAETAIRADPNYELIDSDDEAGTITFRNNKTGEEATMNFQDIAEGKWSVTTDEGEFKVDANDGGEGGVTLTGPEGETRIGGSTTLDDVPEWVPLYPDATQTQSAYSAKTAQGVGGAVTIQTQDAAKKVVEYYKQQFEDAGYSITAETSSATPQGGFASIMGELSGRTVAVGAVEQGGSTQVTINYNSKP